MFIEDFDTWDMTGYYLYSKLLRSGVSGHIGTWGSWNKRTIPDLEAAVSYFNQAITKDPGYALAYSGLADAYEALSTWGGIAEDVPKSNAAAGKALELDPSLGHPHAVLGSNKVRFDWDFAGGEAEFTKAFELDPNDATGHQWYAEIIGLLGGREKESLAEIDRAHQLDPLSQIIGITVAEILIDSRKYDEALAVCQAIVKENPTYAIAHSYLADAYWGKRMYPQLIDEQEVYGQLSGDRAYSEYASAMRKGFRSGGWKRALTTGIDTLQAQRKTGDASAYSIATMYAALGDKEQAFRWLNTAYQEHDAGLMSLNTDYSVDFLRSDPRFAELVRRVGLPQ